MTNKMIENIKARDGIKLRCGAVISIKYAQLDRYNYNLMRLVFDGYDPKDYYYTLDGKSSTTSDINPFDIVEVIPAPEPEVFECISKVSFSNGMFYKKTEEPIFMKYNNTFGNLQEPIVSKLKYKVNVTNKKILSVEVCDDTI